MRIVRATEGRRVPWKNGGGWTTEIAVHPANAGLEDFVWRLSTAQVTADGPFSLFSGIDRSLAILDGAGLRLTIGADEHVVAQDQPLRFPGDVPTRAALLAGPVTDLNMMTRRSRARHRMRRTAVMGERSVDGDADGTLVYCTDGRLTLGDASLHTGDCAILDSKAFELDGDGTAVLIEIVMR